MATTQTTYPSQWTAEGLFNLWNSAGALANAPYSPYTGDVYAGLNQTQLNAINGLNGIGNVSSPYFGLAGDWMKGAMATSGYTGQPFAQGATYLSNAAGYGDAATGYNNQAGAYGQQAANYVGQGAGYANTAAGIGQQALGYGQQASGLVNQGARYGSQAANYVGQGAGYANTAANIAAGALGYGQQAAGLVNDGRQYGQQAAGMIGQGSQYGAQAADYANQLGQTKITPMAFSSQALQQYLDPGQQALVDATMNTLQRQNAQQQNKLVGNAIAKGAWGGDRAGVAQAELMGQQGLVNAQTVADLNSRNYTQALNQFNTQQGVDLQGQLANANNIGQASGLLSNIGGLYGQFGNSLLGAGNLSNSLAGTMLGAGNLQNSVANTYSGLGSLSNQFAGSMLGAGNLYNSLAGTTNQTGALANNVAGMYSGLGSLSNQFGNTMLGAGNLSLGQGQLALGQGQLNMGLGNASTNLGSAISGVSRDQAALASMYAGLGPAAQNAQLQGYLAQLQGGNQLQADKQGWYDSMYNTWNQNQQGPYNQLGWLSNVYQGLNPQLGGTTIGSGQQSGNTASQIAGGLTSGVGALGATGAFGSSGWLLPAISALKDGGRAYADGGIAPDQPSAEPMRDLLAQAGDMASPDQPRSGVYLSAANIAEWGPKALEGVLSAGVPIPDFDGNGGVLVAKDKETAAQALSARNAGVPLQSIIGAVTGAGNGKPVGASDVVQQVMPDGAVARESLAAPGQVPAVAGDFAAPGRDVRILPVMDAIARRSAFAKGGSVSPESFGLTEDALKLADYLAQNYGQRGTIGVPEAPQAPMTPPDVGGSAIRDALRFTQGLGETGLGFAAGGVVANDNPVAKALREIAPTVKAIKGSAKPAGNPAPRRPQAGLGGMRMPMAGRQRYAVGGSVGNDQEAKRRQAMEFYIRQGYSPAQAAGMVGNLMVESTSALNPMAVGDNGTSYGISQWRGDRRRDLSDFAKGRGLDPNAFDTQLRYSNMELQGPEAAAGAKIRGASTPQEAATAATDFFRPAGWKRNDPSNAMHLNDRVQNALEVAKQFGGAGAADMPAEGATEAQQPPPQQPGGSDLDKWMPLITGGLAMMAGRSKNAWENIGQGALAGVQQYGQYKRDTQRAAQEAETMKLRQAADARDERNAVRQEKIADLQGQNILSQIEERRAASQIKPEWKPVIVKGPDGTESTMFQRGEEFATPEKLGFSVPSGGNREKAPAGFRWAADGRTLERIPGGPGEKTTEDQNKNSQLYTRSKEQLGILLGDGTEKTPGTFNALSGTKDQIAGKIPYVGNMLASDDYQRASTALKDIAASYLYSVSGAAAGAKEVEGLVDSVMPRPGDGPKTLAEKKSRVRDMVESIGLRAKGPGQGAQPEASGGQYREGQTATNPQSGQKIVFRNGKWEPVQ